MSAMGAPVAAFVEDNDVLSQDIYERLEIPP
jgi:hypothetical protein